MSTSKAYGFTCVTDSWILRGEAKWGFASTKAWQTWEASAFSLLLLVGAVLEDVLYDFAKMVLTDPS